MNSDFNVRKKRLDDANRQNFMLLIFQLIFWAFRHSKCENFVEDLNLSLNLLIGEMLEWIFRKGLKRNDKPWNQENVFENLSVAKFIIEQKPLWPLSQVFWNILEPGDERVGSNAEICEANKIKFENFLNFLVDFIGLLNFMYGSNQMQRFSVLELRDHFIDSL
jgi:hypothetical protein